MASRTTPLLAPLVRQLRPRLPPSRLFRESPRCRNRAPLLPVASIRAAHTIPSPPSRTPIQPKTRQTPAQEASAEDAPTSEGERPEIRNPAYYQLSFTCLPCGHRSHHNVSKQGYHHGSTLITCPSCHNRHIISDHLGIFGDRNITVEDLMREKGQLVKKGSLGEDGDIEFWPDDQATQQGEGDGKKDNA